MTIKLWDSGYVTDEVSSIKSYQANTSEENRIKFVTDNAAISRGKTESNNPKKRYEHLLKEAAPNTCENGCKSVAGRPLEWIPVVVDYMKYFEIFSDLDITIPNKILPFSYLSKDLKLYTNLRALYNAGMPYKMIPYNTEEELKDFKAIRVKAPYFVFAQIRTHCKISQIAASARVIDENELWLPSDFKDRVVNNFDFVNNLLNMFDTYDPYEKDNLVDDILEDLQWNWDGYTTRQLQMLMQELGYKREIWQRYPTHALYKTWVMAGWDVDPKVWEHFFIERGVYDNKYKNWVQPETKEVAKAIYKIIRGK